MQGTCCDLQDRGVKTLLQALTSQHSLFQHCVDPLLTQLTQPKPELEDLSRATSLETQFTAMGNSEGGLHVGEARVECVLKS